MLYLFRFRYWVGMYGGIYMRYDYLVILVFKEFRVL